jgi:hypothetical protein
MGVLFRQRMCGCQLIDDLISLMGREPGASDGLNDVGVCWRIRGGWAARQVFACRSAKSLPDRFIIAFGSLEYYVVSELRRFHVFY